MSVKNISSAILGVGVDDTTIDLFESPRSASKSTIAIGICSHLRRTIEC